MAATLYFEFALPDDPELDRFESGEEEVNTYFRSRQWFNAEKVSYPSNIDQLRPTFGYQYLRIRGHV